MGGAEGTPSRIGGGFFKSRKKKREDRQKPDSPVRDRGKKLEWRGGSISQRDESFTGVRGKRREEL